MAEDKQAKSFQKLRNWEEIVGEVPELHEIIV